MAEPFVILYELQVYNGPAQWHVRLWHRAVEGTALNPLPANPHFVAKFQPLSWKPQYLWLEELDTPAVVPSFATNPHFIGQFKGMDWLRKVFPPPTNVPIQAADVPTYFLARYTPTQLYLDRTVFQKPTEDQSTPTPSFATNQHFTARYSPTQLYRPTFPQPTDVGISVADVPTYVIAPYKTTTFYFDRTLFQKPTEDQSTPTPTFETNQHFVARYTQPSLYRPIFPQTTDGVSAVVPDSPLHFVARFQPVGWKPQYLWARAVDEGTVGLSADVPTYFVARYSPSVWRPQYLWVAALDVQLFEANAHCVAIYQERLRFNIRTFLSSIDGTAPVADNPVYFTARFQPVVWRAQYLWVNALDAPTVETNVHFVARYSPSVLYIDRALFQKPTEDLSTPVATFATNVNFMASFSPTVFKLDASLHLVPATDFIQQAPPPPVTQYPTPFGAFITFGKMG